jgi:hypothetical protein
LIQQQLTVVVVDIALVAKVLNAAAESGHATRNRTHLVLCNAKLDMREDEGSVEIDGLLVVGRGGAEF